MQIVMLVSIGIVVAPALHCVNHLLGLVFRARLHRQLRGATRGTLVLSYDDGPSERLHGRILTILAESKVPATFYVLTARTEVMESSLRATAAAGHEVASHGFAHLDARRVSACAIWCDLSTGFRFMERAGFPSRTFRPPFGRVTLTTVLQARREKSALALWTVDSGDTLRVRPSVESIVAQVERDGGGVVLLHSHDRSSAEAEEFAVLVTRALIEFGKRRGYRFTTCADLLASE